MTKKIGLVLGPLLFILINFFVELEGLSPAAQSTLASALWIAVWWITEALPISATALLPLVLFPLNGIMGAKSVASGFAKPMIFLFMGGFILAVAIEKTNLHKRIALNIVHALGSDWIKVLLGFMLATAFLSMWISNTATAVMMLPIGMAVISQLKAEEAAKRKMGQSLMLSIAYGCSIGGMATIIGTPTNVIFTQIASDLYGENITFAQWIAVGLPFSLLALFVAWFYLAKVAYRVSVEGIPGGKATIKAQLSALGPMGYQEKMVAVVFVFMALSWILGSLVLKKFVPGISDMGIAIAGALLLFIIPSGHKDGKGILDWKTAEGIPWGVLLLFGGGLALADGFKVSGLSVWLGGHLTVFGTLPIFLLLFAIIFVVNFLTEITSNVATASMLMPVLAGLAFSIDVHPYVLMVGATLAASCAFMLPVATPPNAVVFGSGLLSIRDMIRVGFWMNIISVLLAAILIYFLLPFVWGIDIDVFPEAFR